LRAIASQTTSGLRELTETGVARADRDHCAAVRERVEERVDPADVVEQQKRQRDHALPRRLELLEQACEVVKRGLALARRARREQDKTGRLRFA